MGPSRIAGVGHTIAAGATQSYYRPHTGNPVAATAHGFAVAFATGAGIANGVNVVLANWGLDDIAAAA